MYSKMYSLNSNVQKLLKIKKCFFKKIAWNFNLKEGARAPNLEQKTSDFCTRHPLALFLVLFHSNLFISVQDVAVNVFLSKFW